MKNVIPVITAVLLGLATVFMVKKAMSGNSKETATTPMAKVLVVKNSGIQKDEPFTPTNVGTKTVPTQFKPQGAIEAGEINSIYNQKAKRNISQGDYILRDDIELEVSKSDVLEKEHWGVPVTFSDSSLLQMLKPGDEIAIIGTFSYEDTRQVDKNAANVKTEKKNVTGVIYPCVTILTIDGPTVLLSMPPDQAIALTAIQRRAKLAPLLRKKNDTSYKDISNCGRYEDDALAKLVGDMGKVIDIKGDIDIKPMGQAFEAPLPAATKSNASTPQ